MKKFIFGLVLGMMLSAGATYAGMMLGFTVTIHTDAGDATCEDPDIWSSIKEIECDGELE